VHGIFLTGIFMGLIPKQDGMTLGRELRRVTVVSFAYKKQKERILISHI
jgi:hypothetical protein